MLSFIGFLTVILFLFTGLSLILLAIRVQRRDSSQLSRVFSVLVISCAIWVFCHLLGLVFTTESWTLFWGKMKYFGIVILAVSWLMFSFEYTGRGKYITRRIIALLLIIPAVSMISLWTNDYHHLFYVETAIEELGGITYFSATFGPFFWLITAFVYSLVLVGVVLVMHALSNLHRFYSKQALVVAIGVLTPLIGNIIYLYSPSPGLDFTPLLFLPSSISLAYAIEHFDFIDALLIGRRRVFEGTVNSIYVLDNRGMIIDLNEAGENLAREIGYRGDPIRKDFEEVLSKKLNLPEGREGSRIEFALDVDEDKRYMEAQIDPLQGVGGGQVGWTMIIRDITWRKEAQERKDFLNTLLRQDLRSKCQTVRGYLRLLEESNIPDRHGEYLERVIDASRESEEIINMAKELHEIENSEWIDRRNIFNLVDHAVKDTADLAERENVEINRDYSAQVDQVRGTYSLERLIVHILKTRILNSDCDNIEISVERKDGRTVLQIEDDGEKLPKVIKDLFSGKSYTGDSAGAHGVKYYMIREIADQTNATIRVNGSAMGGGKFSLLLEQT